MKYLILAHPDDEIIFFNPDEADKIVIVFGDFGDSRGKVWGDRRRAALKELPYADKIIHLDLPESHWTWDRNDRTQRDYINPQVSAERWRKYEQNYKDVCEFLKSVKADEIITHGSWGEYGNLDHVLVHHACLDTVECSVRTQPLTPCSPQLYRAAKQIYKTHGCWTWYF